MMSTWFPKMASETPPPLPALISNKGSAVSTRQPQRAPCIHLLWWNGGGVGTPGAGRPRLEACLGSALCCSGSSGSAPSPMALDPPKETVLEDYGEVWLKTPVIPSQRRPDLALRAQQTRVQIPRGLLLPEPPHLTDGDPDICLAGKVPMVCTK